MDKYKFGEYIYKKRKELGYTQEELGRKLNLTNKAISKWETGETLPEVTMLTDLANVLGITVDELLTQTKPEIHYEKPKKTPIILLSILCGLISIAFLVFAVVITRPSVIEITEDNYTEYYNITLAGSTLKDTSIKIKVTIEDINVTNPSLEINCTVDYYYIRGSKEGEVTYSDRFITYDGSQNVFYLELTPAYELSDITFVGYEISYVLVSVKGEIIK